MEVSGLTDTQPLGMFDSGIGGLTVLDAIARRLPAERIVYFGDTARLPYGTKSRETVTRFSREIVGFLMTKKPKLIVVACNTASAYSLPVIRKMVDVPVIGVVEPGAGAALRATRNNRIGVIGTRATIDSGAYLEAIQTRKAGAKVFSKACPLFVPLIEEGWIESPITLEVARQYLDPLTACGIDTLILGCTHYPLLKGVLEKVVEPGVVMVDSAEETAKEVEQVLATREMLSPSLAGPRCELFVSDMHLTLGLQVRKFMGFEVPRIRVVNSEFEEVTTGGI
jgi:glutamate racemase